MRNVILSGTALLALLGAPLMAQEARMGVSLNVSVPTGAFASTTYGPDYWVSSSTKESYDVGVGGQFNVSLPMDKRVAMRLSLGAQSFTGRATATGYDSLNLKEEMFSLGAEMQFFGAEGSAYRQSGTYFLAGASLDFERFDSSYGDPDYYASNTLHKTRVGGIVGIGHTFRPGGGMRYLVEAAYHKTLTQTDTAAGDPPAADFVRFSFGFIL